MPVCGKSSQSAGSVLGWGMSDHAIKVHEKDPAYGWVMVFAVFLLSALALGALGSISVFLKPLSSEF